MATEFPCSIRLFVLFCNDDSCATSCLSSNLTCASQSSNCFCFAAPAASRFSTRFFSRSAVAICCLVAAICLARSGRWLSTDFILASSCNFFKYNCTVSTSPISSPAFSLVPSSTSSRNSFPAASAETITSVASNVPVAS